jgi:hypothetical protein
MTAKTSIEIFLGELILYVGVFIWNDHVGFLLCTIFGSITLVLLLISYVVELIERSKVPRWYFLLMWISLVAPLITILFFVGIGGIHFMDS